MEENDQQYNLPFDVLRNFAENTLDEEEADKVLKHILNNSDDLLVVRGIRLFLESGEYSKANIDELSKNKPKLNFHTMTTQNTTLTKEVRVMIVDDHLAVSESLAALINKRPGYKVIKLAKNGREAIGYLEKMEAHEYPDIVLMDLFMEEVDNEEPAGFQTTRKIFKEFNKKIRVIILSAEVNGLYIHTAQNMNIQGYLAKEAGSEEIFKAIDVVMKGGMYYRGKVDAEMSRYRQAVIWLNEEIFPPSAMEQEILELTADGLTADEISVKRNMTVAAVEGHRKMLMKKFKAKNAVNLVSIAYQHGYLKIYKK